MTKIIQKQKGCVVRNEVGLSQDDKVAKLMVSTPCRVLKRVPGKRVLKRTPLKGAMKILPLGGIAKNTAEHH